MSIRNTDIPKLIESEEEKEEKKQMRLLAIQKLLKQRRYVQIGFAITMVLVALLHLQELVVLILNVGGPVMFDTLSMSHVIAGFIITLSSFLSYYYKYTGSFLIQSGYGLSISAFFVLNNNYSLAMLSGEEINIFCKGGIVIFVVFFTVASILYVSPTFLECTNITMLLYHLLCLAYHYIPIVLHYKLTYFAFVILDVLIIIFANCVACWMLFPSFRTSKPVQEKSADDNSETVSDKVKEE